MKKSPLELPKIKTKSQLRKEADKLFSLFIRLRDRNERGLTVCYTCNREMEYKKAQNGHFVPRQYLSVRYNEINCHAQCYACNMLYNGQPSAYALRLTKDYGEGIVETLEKTRHTLFPNFDYARIIALYTEKLKALSSE